MHYEDTPRPGMMEGMYVGGLFWDGRADTLTDQAKQPLLNPLEMHNPSKLAVVLEIRRSKYAALFRAVCGPIALSKTDEAFDCAARAVTAYELSPEVSPFTSKYDSWKKGQAQLTPAEYNGYVLFTSKAKCSNCHSEPLFTNFGYQNVGTPRNPELPYYFLPRSLNPDGVDYIDRGLGDVLRRAGVPEEQAAKEDGRFKIPSLRNCALTAPYEHNGVFKTLREVVVFNNTRDVANPPYPTPEVPNNVHRHMPPMSSTFGRLGLTDQEVDDIVAFLHTLNDGYQP